MTVAEGRLSITGRPTRASPATVRVADRQDWHSPLLLAAGSTVPATRDTDSCLGRVGRGAPAARPGPAPARIPGPGQEQGTCRAGEREEAALEKPSALSRGTASPGADMVSWPLTRPPSAGDIVSTPVGHRQGQQGSG